MESEHKYQFITENLKVMVWTIDIESQKFTYVSPYVSSLLGYTPEEFTNGAIEKSKFKNKLYTSTHDKMIADVEACMKKKCKQRNFVYEYQLPHKCGRQIWVETELQLIEKDKQLSEIVGFTRDIEERKNKAINTEKYLKQLQQKDTDLERLLKILAHDLRSPFNVILGLTECLSTNYGNLQHCDVKQQLNLIQTTARDTYFMLEDLLLWTNMKTFVVNKEPIVLRNLCDEVCGILQGNAKYISLSIQVATEDVVLADRRILKTVLRNLLSNAIKFTPEKGWINIESRKTSGATVLSISDSGVGMSIKQQENLWNGSMASKGGTKHEKGFGIGLALCKELIEKCGGSIWVESELKNGSKFSFSIPNLNSKT